MPMVWTTSAPFYNDFRWQRQPAESLSLGRTFGLDKEGRFKFDVRVEFYNVFNRLFLASPAVVGNTTGSSDARSAGGARRCERSEG